MIKRVLFYCLPVILIFAGKLNAQENAPSQAGTMHHSMMSQDEKQSGRGGMGMGRMAGMMMHSSMVAASDGGVIVLAGNKLMKYDRDLNLVKEVVIKTEMCAMMQQGSDNCPMNKMMTAGQGNPGAGPNQATGVSSAAQQQPDKQ
jgi:hypothetical protein